MPEAFSVPTHILCMCALLVLAVLILLCMIRAIKGPRISDRIISINMIGTMVIAAIALLAYDLSEGYLLDVCLVYALLSFLAVIVLTKVYLGIHREGQRKRAEREEEGE